MRKVKRAAVFILLLFFLTCIAAYGAYLLHQLLRGGFRIETLDYGPANMLECLVRETTPRFIFFALEAMAVAWLVFVVWRGGTAYKNDMQEITPDIVTPKPCGEKQHGSARWLRPSEYSKAFREATVSRLNRNIRKLIRYGYRDLSFYKHNYLYQSAVIEKLFFDASDSILGLHLIVGRYEKTEKFHHMFIASKRNTLVFGARYLYTKKHRFCFALPDLYLLKTAYALSDICTEKPLVKGGGYVVGGEKKLVSDVYRYIAEDTHSVTVGGTRVGKTRYVALVIICLLALAGESMVNVDVKGELYLSAAPFLKRLGYKVQALDFVEPEKSDRYNFFTPIISYLKQGEISKAQDATWDIVSSLVGEAKGEKIWNNGECSVIAFSIFCVAWENQNNPRFQNMTNAYHFIAEMCRAAEKDVLPIIKYAEQLPDSHPAKSLIRISEVAPQRTRGSFFTSALATLRLFTNDSISYMTSGNDIDIEKTGDQKTAIFIILPDEKTTYNGIATLFINQQYQQLVKRARQNGNRLSIRVNFNEDEKGNFPAIPDYDTAITAGGGRGIRFNMFLQSFSQLYDKYGKEKADTIIHNCEIWNLMQSTSDSTIKQFQERMGSYTVKSQSGSSSANMSGYQSSFSSSYNLMPRKLLENDEFGKIDRPYQLVLSRQNPAMMTALPLEKTLFNKMLGLGDKEHNQRVFKDRNERRPAANVTRQSDNLWGVWKEWQKPTANTKNIEPTQSQGATSRYYLDLNDEETEDYYTNCATREEYGQSLDEDE